MNYTELKSMVLTYSLILVPDGRIWFGVSTCRTAAPSGSILTILLQSFVRGSVYHFVSDLVHNFGKNLS
jgi:hypothetical protein